MRKKRFIYLFVRKKMFSIKLEVYRFLSFETVGGTRRIDGQTDDVQYVMRPRGRVGL